MSARRSRNGCGGSLVLALALLLGCGIAAAHARAAAPAKGHYHDGVGASCGGTGCHPDVAPHAAGPREEPPAVPAAPAAKEVSCLDCHDLGSVESPARLHDASEAVCLDCHAEALEPPRPRRMPGREEKEREAPPEPQAHGPVAEGRCGACHRMHGERASGLLRGRFPAGSYSRYSAAAYTACLGACHPESLIEKARTRSATAFRNGDDNLHFRHVVRGERGQSCRLCHAPHRALGRGLVAGFMPYGTQKLTLRWSASKRGGRCETSCHMALGYDRNEAIGSPLRIRDRR